LLKLLLPSDWSLELKISEASNAEVKQVIGAWKYISFLTPDMALKNDARRGIDCWLVRQSDAMSGWHRFLTLCLAPKTRADTASKNDAGHGIDKSELSKPDAMCGIAFWRHGWRQKACRSPSEWVRIFSGECTYVVYGLQMFSLFWNLTQEKKKTWFAEV